MPLTVERKRSAERAVARSAGGAIAAQELGAPYRYGGRSPSGFDCSGLVAYVYGKLGVPLPHNAAAQYSYGRAVDRDHLKPGDLVFFHGLGHVGLYIGSGRIIHAPQSGERVEIQRLASAQRQRRRRPPSRARLTGTPAVTTARRALSPSPRT